MLELNLSAKAKLFFAALVIAGLIAIAFFLNHRPKPALSSLRHIRFAVPGFQSSALILIAKEHNYFRDEGIEATFEFFSTGKSCLDRVLQGKADFAVVFETPTMHAALAGNKLAVITELHRSESSSAIASRKDRGIREAADLVGRKIAVVPKTNAEYLLNLYLKSHMIRPERVKVKKMNIEQALAKLKNGQIDAAALWEPYLSQALINNPDALTLLQSPYYSEFSLLVGLHDSLLRDEEPAYAVIRALQSAASYYEENEKKAQHEVDRFLTKQGVLVAENAWGRLDIHLGLSSTLLAMFNAEASSVRSTEDHYIRVNLRDLLQGRFLKKVLPQTVTYE